MKLGWRPGNEAIGMETFCSRQGITYMYIELYMAVYFSCRWCVLQSHSGWA